MIQRDTKQDPSKNEYTTQIWFLAEMWFAKQHRSTKQCPLGMIHLVLTILLCDSVEKYPDGSRARGSSQVIGCKWGHVSHVTLWKCHSASDVTTNHRIGWWRKAPMNHRTYQFTAPLLWVRLSAFLSLKGCRLNKIYGFSMVFPENVSIFLASLRHPTFSQIQINFSG